MICWFLYLLLLVGFSQSVQNKHHLDAQVRNLQLVLINLTDVNTSAHLM